MSESDHTTNRQFEYTGFKSPNGTIVPDDVFDVLMPQLRDGELRVLLYIIRKTFGWKKESDNISLSQMVNSVMTKDGRVQDRGTGLKKSAVTDALKGLRAKKVIKVVRNRSIESGNEPTTYMLRFEGEADEMTDANTVAKQTELVPLSARTDKGVSADTDKGLSARTDTQETRLQTTDFDHSNIRKSNRSKDDFVDNSTSYPISVEANRSVSRNGSGTHYGVEGVGSIMARVGPQREATQPDKRQRGRPRKFQDQDSQTLLNYVSDFAREFSDKATLNQSATRMINLYHKWGKSDIDAFVGMLYQARSVTKAQNNIRTSKFAYFCSVVEDLLGLREESDTVSSRTS